MVKISPQWVTSPEKGTSSGRVATFNLWTDVIWDGISSMPDETVTAVIRSSLPLLCEQGVPREGDDD